MNMLLFSEGRNQRQQQYTTERAGIYRSSQDNYNPSLNDHIQQFKIALPNIWESCSGDSTTLEAGITGSRWFPTLTHGSAVSSSVGVGSTRTSAGCGVETGIGAPRESVRWATSVA